MKLAMRRLFAQATAVGLLLIGWAVHAQEVTPPAPPTPPEPPEVVEDDSPPWESDRERWERYREEWRERRAARRRHNGENAIVQLGSNSYLAADAQADSVVSIFGSAIADGDVSWDVVSILGDARASGAVGNNVVAVLGSVYINGKVGNDAVAVLGNVQLGPQAEVDGNVAVVGGRLIRHPDARIRGNVSQVGFGGVIRPAVWLQPWIREAALYGRPLAIAPGLNWAWIIALGSLALYALIALLAPASVERCVRTLKEQPGQSILTSILTVLLTPIVFIVLTITIIGIMLIPFVGIALFLGALFGKAVVLAAIGNLLTRKMSPPLNHMAIAVLIGGVIVLGLYLIPVVGFITYNLTGVLGLGVVIYTLLLVARAKQDVRVSSAQPLAAASPSGATTAASAFTVTDSSTGAPESSTSASTGFTAETSSGSDASASSDASSGAAAAAASPTPGQRTAQAISPAMAATLPRAGFGIRMLALFIDVVLVSAVVSMLPDSLELSLITLAAYGAVMWKLRSTTIGGIICNLQVVRVDGREIDWAVAIVRALSCFLSLVPLGLGFIWIAFDNERQAWHDKIAGTVVVRMPKAVSLL